MLSLKYAFLIREAASLANNVIHPLYNTPSFKKKPTVFLSTFVTISRMETDQLTF